MAMESLIIFAVIYLLILAAVLVINYVLPALSLYTIAKRRNLPMPGLAWVPVANVWTFGSIADQFESLRRQKPVKMRGWLLALAIAEYAVLAVFFVIYILMFGDLFSTLFQNFGSPYGVDEDILFEGIFSYLGIFLIAYLLLLAVAIAYSVIYYICLYRLYLSTKPQNAIVFLVLSILFGITRPFFLMACRKDDAPIPQPAVQSPYPPTCVYPQETYTPPAPPVSVPQEGNIRFCTACGAKVSPESQFCTTCGKKLEQ